MQSRISTFPVAYATQQRGFVNLHVMLDDFHTQRCPFVVRLANLGAINWDQPRAIAVRPTAPVFRAMKVGRGKRPRLILSARAYHHRVSNARAMDASWQAFGAGEWRAIRLLVHRDEGR